MTHQTVLVTGGAGFIGSHFIEYLLRNSNVNVVCIDEFNNFYDPMLKRENVLAFANDPRVKMTEGSFCDQETVDAIFSEHAISYVVHFGAYAGVRYSIENPTPYQRANVDGTLKLLEAVRKHPVKRFVFASSSTVYGKGAPAPFVEDQPLGVPLSPYGATKRAGELLCLTYHELFEVPVVCLRFFSVYGPRLRPDLALTIFTKAIDAGEALPLFGDGTIRRDFTHIEDICRGVAAAVHEPRAVGECINLGHHDPIEMRELISLIEKHLGKKAEINYLPEKLGDMPITHADLSKAADILGYAPKQEIDAGVAEFVAWHGRPTKAMAN